MSQLIASNYLNKLWITFSSKHTLWTSSAKTPHLTMSTMIGMSKWRMESASAKTITSVSDASISLHNCPRPQGSWLMENTTNALTMQTTPNQIKNGGTYAVALSSVSQSMQIPLHTSSAAHQANRFLSCSSLPTSFAPLNVTIKWRMESHPRSSAMSLSLRQISSLYFS